jgi:hypothetical protein
MERLLKTELYQFTIMLKAYPSTLPEAGPQID